MELLAWIKSPKAELFVIKDGQRYYTVDKGYHNENMICSTCISSECRHCEFVKEFSIKA